ncbi:MAG: radical SAM family heme chaperone HemW [Prevotella sp.]|nr:radical SAM family heme chaperone HemW [Prevotella sp.]
MDSPGLYIHIPFCKSRCIYCGFYSTTRLDLRQRYVDAVCREYQQTRTRLAFDGTPHTIYIGGGTPSTLTGDQLRQLFDTVGAAEEVTIECNPDDVTTDFAKLLSQLPVNRVSMGVQTFNEQRLRFLCRRHTAAQAVEAVTRLRSIGIDNVSIDLMYGFPEETLAEWNSDIDQALRLDVEHISAYALTYEEGTPLWKMLQRGQVSEIDEDMSRQMYYGLCDRLEENGYEHYEISNFARPGRRSRHNSGYWNQTSYIGLGAAAHSYDGKCRRWNVSDFVAYIEGVENGCAPYDSEEIDNITRYNEMVMTALRTADGLPLNSLAAEQRTYCLDNARRYIENGLLSLEADRLRLTRCGLFVSDMIMTDLMMA